MERVEGKYPMKAVLAVAERIVQQRIDGSIVLDPLAEAKFPKLQGRELEEGSTLGEGFFCKVNEITEISLETNPEDSLSSSEQLEDERKIYNHVQDRSFMEIHCRRGTDNDCRYALKRLKPKTCVKAEDLINGIVDLAIEAKFLAVIRHPNIIKMRAMAYHGPFSSVDPYFIVLDRLNDTLLTQIVKWRSKLPSSAIAGLFGGNRKAKKEFMNERISVASDIASALQYLHEKHIIYRDLKGDNVGFDVRGDVKIFDFGLSKEFNPAKKNASGMYHLTECTGSPRYMAPEVALGQPYNETADVYSFCLLLWQMLKLATPFNGLNVSQLNKDVYIGGLRPKISRSWPRSIRTMMKFGWGSALVRPSMKEMVKVLRMECGLESVADVSKEFCEERVSRSFISAVNLGYKFEPPKVENHSDYCESVVEGKVNESLDIGESQSGDEEEDIDETDNKEEEFAASEETDMPCLSFIVAGDLPQLLVDEKEEEEAVDIQSGPQTLFPFVPAG